MKLPNIPLYESNKKNIIEKYPILAEAISNLENSIMENPESGKKEVLLIENRHVKTRRRGMRTNLFSNRLPDHYLYLTINYGLTGGGDVAFLSVYLRDYVI